LRRELYGRHLPLPSRNRTPIKSTADLS